MRLVFVSFVLVSAFVFLCQHCEAIRPIIRLRPKIVLGKGYDTEDDSLKIYRTIAKTVISGYLFGALRRPFGFISHHGGWDGASPLSVTFAVGGKRPYNSDHSSDSDKSPKVEKIKIIEKEKEKPVKHIVISHKILGPPASSMSVTGGHLMPGMLEESAMAVMGSEMASPWSETQRQYSTLDSGEDSSFYGIPSALDTRRKVKIVKIKETSSSDDEDEYIEDDEGDSSGDYKVIKRKVYSYKDKSVEEPKTSKYGYNPNYSGEQVVAESTQAHVIRIDNGTEINYAVTPEPMIVNHTATAIPTFDLITDATINQTNSSNNSSVTINQPLATFKPDQLTTRKNDLNVTKTYKIESSNLVKSKSKNQTKNANKSNKTTKESVVVVDDPWLDYLNQKELQESQSISSKQSAKIVVEPVAERKKNSRKNGNRRRKSKKSKSRSRSRDNVNLDSDRLESRSYDWDEVSSISNHKINSVKAFGDGWVSRRRNKSKSKSRRRSSSERNNKSKAKYRIIRMPSLSSAQNLAFNQMIALPSTSLTSLPSTGPIVFPTSMKRSLLESSLLSSNPILIPSPTLSNSMLHRRSFRS